MRHLRLVCTLVALTAFTAVISSQTPSGHALFEQALAKERVEGNLSEAITLYERVVAEFASDRALAAQALVQIGLSYEKLGRDEAVRAYERLVRDFADQEDAVEQARARLAVLRRPAPGAATATAPRLRALPRVDNVNEVRTLSPDGTKAAFKSYDTGGNLAVYDMATQQTTLLTNVGGKKVFVEAPTWSPDGRRVAHMQCDLPFGSRCELRVATLAGESQALFDSTAFSIVPAGWLPDGSALIVMLIRADRTLSIGVVQISDGTFTQLRSIGNWVGTYEWPSVSPDGQYVAFAEGSPGTRDIHVISRDGRTAQRITDHPADDHGPIWSPDGRHLAFLSARDGSKALWAVAIRDGLPTAGPVRIKDGMAEVVSLLGWTTRGLAYLDRQRSEDIYTVPVDLSRGVPPGSPRLIAYGRTGRNAAPAWSPDGTYLAFRSSSPAEPDRRAIVVMPSGGGESREFPIPTNLWPISLDGPNDLRWFGDSRGLGFSGINTRGERTLFRLTLATGEWKTFPHAVEQSTSIEWNTDGTRYFYARHGATRAVGDDLAIVERDLQSNRERIVLQGKAQAFGETYRRLKFSPDRRVLAFSSGGQRFQVVDSQSGQTRVVYEEALGNTTSFGVPTWSPDGRALLVNRTENSGTDKQTTDFRLIPVDGGEIRRIPLGAELTRLLSGRGAGTPAMRDVVWSPDGGRFAFAVRALRLEGWMIENPLALAGAADASARK